jgi:hypothetical protein
MSEEARSMVGLDKTVVGSDALPRRRICYLVRRHTSVSVCCLTPCARLRPEVTGRTQELSLLHLYSRPLSER